jgi:hypothetical protein
MTVADVRKAIAQAGTDRARFNSNRYAFTGYQTHVSDGKGGEIALVYPEYVVRFGWAGGVRNAFSFGQNAHAAEKFAIDWATGN